ncbi:GNAT family N-acetyltransferase [Arthrobacter sp. D1-29]
MMSTAGTAPIETERLTLRLLTPADAAAVHSFRGDEAVTRFLSHGPLTAEENRVRLEEVVERAAVSTHEWFHYGWAITLRETGQLIGDGRTWNSAGSPARGTLTPGRLPSHQASLGYVLHPHYQGRGYGREAAGALVQWLFRELGVSTVFAGVYEPNTASIRLLRHLGFTRDGYVAPELDKFGKGFPSLMFRLDNPGASSG